MTPLRRAYIGFAIIGAAVIAAFAYEQYSGQSIRTLLQPLPFSARKNVTADTTHTMPSTLPTFGTGTHATTALCLEYLAQQPPHGAHFIDIGCGSGILSIAALRLGATRGHAMDIDPQALIATDENAQRNSVRAQLTLGDETTGWDGQYNLILANILAEPLIALADRIAGIASPGATVLLSGLLDTQTDSVLRAYEGHFTMAKPLLKDGWAALYGTFNA